jgi:hypothetical protein
MSAGKAFEPDPKAVRAAAFGIQAKARVGGLRMDYSEAELEVLAWGGLHSVLQQGLVVAHGDVEDQLHEERARTSRALDRACAAEQRLDKLMCDEQARRQAVLPGQA